MKFHLFLAFALTATIYARRYTFEEGSSSAAAAEEESEARWRDWQSRQPRNRLAMPATARVAAVRHRQLAEMEPVVRPAPSAEQESQSSERIRQFIPSSQTTSHRPPAPFGLWKDGSLCPDKQSFCPSGTTCCPLAEAGSFGCCPSPDAVCCSDKIHCCPQNTICDMRESKCLPADADSGEEASHMLKKLPASRVVRKSGVPTTAARVSCAVSPSAQPLSCPSGSTCCRDKERDTASCCPHHGGVCCAATGTCCPFGFRCTKLGECSALLRRQPLGYDSGVLYSKMITTSAAPLEDATEEEEPADSDVTVCGDGSECSGYATCCPVHNAITGAVASYRCCGLSRATCCGVDAEFCCPRGYGCARGQRCERVPTANIFL